MKDSGIEWIGQIPEDWEVGKIRTLVIERFEKNEQLQTKTMLSLSAKSGVTLYNEEENHSGNRPREDLSGYKVVYPNDIVVNSMNILSGAVGLSEYKGCVSPVYYIYKAREKCCLNYIYKIFQSKEFQLSLRGLGNGILIKESENGTLNTIRTRIPSKKLLNEYFPIPSYEEQIKIADILDKKCSQIDELISIQEKEIEKLKEYKTSVITKAVTKGLDDTVPMKDSGIEWIGQIPESYEIIKIKNVCSEKITDGTHLTPTYTSKEEGYPFLSSKDVRNGYIDLRDIKYITLDVHQEISKGITPQKGDVLLSKNGSIGFSAVVDTNKKFDIYVTLAILRPNQKILSKFLKYSLDSETTQSQFKLHLLGIGVPNLHLNVIQDIKILLPNTKEQSQIIEFLDNQCSEIDSLIEIKNKKIAKLQQYKKSLIYEYVTGKRRV